MPQITNKQIWEELKSLCHLIRGEPDDYENSGLVGAVYNNTKFRKFSTKFAWILVVAILGLWGHLIVQIIVNGGN